MNKLKHSEIVDTEPWKAPIDINGIGYVIYQYSKCTLVNNSEKECTFTHTLGIKIILPPNVTLTLTEATRGSLPTEYIKSES